MNNTTTGGYKKDKTLFDYILEHRTTIIAVIFAISLIYLYIIDTDTTYTGDIIKITNPFEDNYGKEYRQIKLRPGEELKLGGAIKKLKSQLRNVK